MKEKIFKLKSVIKEYFATLCYALVGSISVTEYFQNKERLHFIVDSTLETAEELKKYDILIPIMTRMLSILSPHYKKKKIETIHETRRRTEEMYKLHGITTDIAAAHKPKLSSLQDDI